MSESGVDRISGKMIGLGAVGVLGALLFGYEFRIWFASPTSGEFLALVLLAIAWFTVGALTIFLVKSPRIAAALAFLQVLSVWVSLERKFDYLTLAGAVVLFLGFMVAFFRGRAELSNS